MKTILFAALLLSMSSCGAPQQEITQNELKGRSPGGLSKELKTVQAIDLGYELGPRFEDRLPYYKQYGSKGRTVISRVLDASRIAVVTGPIMDNFNNKLPKRIAGLCKQKVGLQNVYRFVSCVSATAHRFIVKHMKYSKKGYKGLRSYCRDHTQLLLETFRKVKLNNASVREFSIDLHILNELRMERNGKKYRFAFDAGHDLLKLKFYPLNENARAVNTLP